MQLEKENNSLRFFKDSTTRTLKLFLGRGEGLGCYEFVITELTFTGSEVKTSIFLLGGKGGELLLKVLAEKAINFLKRNCNGL